MSPSAPHDPLDPGPRVEWGTAVLVFLEVALAVPIALLLFFDDLDLPPFLAPLLVFLVLRIPGDIARAIAGTRPPGLVIEGPSKALSWASVPFGIAYTFTGAAGPGPLWLAGSGLALFALALWGHHARALPHAPRLARAEGTIGAAVAPFALAAASTFTGAASPWDVLVPAAVLTLTGALAARAIVRLHHPGHAQRTLEGWTGWYQSHFFRLSLLLGAVVVYLFVRDTLAGFVPFLFLFEYSFAVFVAAGFLWSLRGFARKQVTDKVPIGPHRRHEQAVERQGETAFDRDELAFGRFLDTGDADDVAALARRLHEDGIEAETALVHVLAHRPERGVLLVHPGWLYGARLLVVGLIAWSVHGALPAPVGAESALFLMAAGVYSAQWNRFGGPWIVKSGLGLLGFALFAVWSGLVDGGRFAGTPGGLLVGALLLAFPLLHPLRARKGKPIPRFLYQGQAPLEAITPLIERHDRSVVVRAAWLAAIGVVVFLLVGELSRAFPEAQVLFLLYLAFAFSFLVHPVLTTAGLRTGRTRAEERHERARRHREVLLRDGLDRLDGLIGPDSERQRRRRTY